LKLGSYLLLGSLAAKDDVAAGYIRARSVETGLDAHGAQAFHRQLARAANINGAKEGDVGLHPFPQLRCSHWRSKKPQLADR
jgi:hypothetical protein